MAFLLETQNSGRFGVQSPLWAVSPHQHNVSLERGRQLQQSVLRAPGCWFVFLFNKTQFPHLETKSLESSGEKRCSHKTTRWFHHFSEVGCTPRVLIHNPPLAQICKTPHYQSLHSPGRELEPCFVQSTDKKILGLLARRPSCLQRPAPCFPLNQTPHGLSVHSRERAPNPFT